MPAGGEGAVEAEEQQPEAPPVAVEPINILEAAEAAVPPVHQEAAPIAGPSREYHPPPHHHQEAAPITGPSYEYHPPEHVEAHDHENEPVAGPSRDFYPPQPSRAVFEALTPPDSAHSENPPPVSRQYPPSLHLPAPPEQYTSTSVLPYPYRRPNSGGKPAQAQKLARAMNVQPAPTPRSMPNDLDLLFSPRLPRFDPSLANYIEENI